MRGVRGRQIPRISVQEFSALANLYQAIARVAQASSARVAFECEGGAHVTFAELLARVDAFGAALDRLSVKPGDRVAVQVEKCIENVALYLATLRQGAVYVPLNTAYTDRELAYFVEDAQPAVLVVEPSRLERAKALAPGTVVATTLSNLALQRAASAPAACKRADSDLAAIVYTSGTTGRSKGAMLSHGNLTSNATVLIDAWGMTDADVLVHALPLYHVHGLFVALHCALLAGACTRLLPRFDVDSTLAALRGATVFMGVPTYYTRLLADGRFPERESRLRLWISGSAPLLPETFAAFEARVGQRILERYGMSEAGMITSNPLTGARLAGTVGRPLPGVDARIRGTDGALIVGADEPGVLEIRGPNVCCGYWCNAEKTREAFTADGYFITGDVVSRDRNGVLSIVGREKDLIISGGLNVYPREVEAEIDALPGVRESAVIGVPHADFGEAVVAVVDSGADGPSETDVIAALRGRLAKFKVPKRVVFVAELPRNPMGKVQKAALRQQYASLLQR